MSHFDTLKFTLIFSLIAGPALAEDQMKLQTLDSAKTQEAVAPAAPAAPSASGLPAALGTAASPLANPTANPTGKPIVVGNPAAIAAAKKKEAAEKQDLQNLINSMKGNSEGGIGIGTGPNGSSIDPNERFQSMNQQIGPGIMEACGEPPASAKAAYQKAADYRKTCMFANRGDTQKIAINDYSGVRMPYMYIFDLNGQCLGKTSVAYGNGAGKSVPQPCNDDGSHLTPPGFFLTSKHNGSSYNESNSLGLTGLDGQGAKGRGVVIHPSQAPGTATTWGCSGVGYGAFRAVQKSLGYGALVYNFFGDTKGPNSCRNKNGLTTHSCRPDAGAPEIPQLSTSQGPPTLR